MMLTFLKPRIAHKPIQLLVLQIAQSLVDNSEAVEVDCIEESGVITLNLRVDPSDTGKIIGKQGRTARSLRTILGAVGMNLRQRYALNIEEKQRPTAFDPATTRRG